MSNIKDNFYIEKFLTEAETARLFDFALRLPPVRKLILPWGNRSQFVSLGTYIEFPSTYLKDSDGYKHDMATAPDEVKAIAANLSNFAGKSINYLSFIAYMNNRSGMTFHQHDEDRVQPDMSVYCVSLGAIRTVALRPLGCIDKSQYEILRPAHGSLYILPSSYNDTHEHAVLADKESCGIRVCVNCKHVESPLWRGRRHAKDNEMPPSPDSPRIRWGSSADYPDAVYVGRRNTRGTFAYPATPFGNYLKLSPLAKFREYALDKMKDAAFAAQVETLRGKDLLCPWCKPNDSNCHARVWLEIANACAPPAAASNDEFLRSLDDKGNL